MNDLAILLEQSGRQFHSCLVPNGLSLQFTVKKLDALLVPSVSPWFHRRRKKSRAMEIQHSVTINVTELEEEELLQKKGKLSTCMRSGIMGATCTNS